MSIGRRITVDLALAFSKRNHIFQSQNPVTNHIFPNTDKKRHRAAGAKSTRPLEKQNKEVIA